ncbi:hypothetical protein AURDEDRAFT_162557 [Auricularia subglabra TFB-10046 SS5]|nr:hypothetical protein AURDEDRAFT_162557 [Auricularia subglabra TFB-10046 SS5]
MISASFSLTSLRSFGSSKSLASFVDELSAASRLAEVASTGAVSRSARRRARPDSSVLPDHVFGHPPNTVTVAPLNGDDGESVNDSVQFASTVRRHRVRPESILPGLLFAKPARAVEQEREDEEYQTNIFEVATVGARRRVRPESILPGLLFAKPLQPVAQDVAVEEPESTMSETTTSSSIASMPSSSKSLTSFKRNLFATGRLGDLNTSGFEARAYRRRVRVVSTEQPAPASASKPSLGANAAAKASTMTLSSRPLAERSPFTKYTPSGTLNLSSVRDRSGKSFGVLPSFFADLEPAQEFGLRGALLLPGMQFTSSSVGAEKCDVLRSLMGEVPAEKTSKLDKLVQVFKRS